VRRHFGFTPQPAPLVTMDDVVRLIAPRHIDVGPSREPGAASAAPGVWWHGRSRRALSGIAGLAALLLLAVLAQALLGARGGQPHTGVGPRPTLAPALSNKAVYLATDDGIYALRASDGTLRWRYPAGDPRSGPYLAGISSAVLVGNTLYVSATPQAVWSGSPTMTIAALRASDGSVIWSRQMPSGIGARLAVSNGVVYVSPNARGRLPSDGGAPDGDYLLYALRASDGTQVWRYRADEPIISALAVAGNMRYVATTANVYALRSAGATLLWRSPIGPGAYPEGYSQSTLLQAAITPTADFLYVLAMVGRKHDTGPDWRIDANLIRNGLTQVGATAAYPPAVGNGSVYVQSGAGIWADPANPSAGPQPVWGSGGAVPMVGPTLADGVVYACGWDGYTYALRASDGHRLWRTETAGGTMSRPPTVSDGAVFAVDGSILYALRAANGAVAWRSVTNANVILAAPVVG
jgi:outer membrane protein assembly factor BamB